MERNTDYRQWTDIGSPDRPPGTKVYTAYFTWDPPETAQQDMCVEEIDVYALNADQAKRRALAVFDGDYEPGGRLVHLEERIGLFW